MVWGVSVG